MSPLFTKHVYTGSSNVNGQTHFESLRASILLGMTVLGQAELRGEQRPEIQRHLLGILARYNDLCLSGYKIVLHEGFNNMQILQDAKTKTDYCYVLTSSDIRERARDEKKPDPKPITVD